MRKERDVNMNNGFDKLTGQTGAMPATRLALRLAFGLALTLAFLVMVCPPAEAAKKNANCRNTGQFGTWLREFKRQARSNGISQRTINRALGGVKFDPRIIRKDRRQGFFSQSFLSFARRVIRPYRMQRGKRLIRKYQRIFARIDKEYGVPAPVIVAFWALESDFGAFMGKDRSLRSLATLAYDCRRPELFRPELMSALKIIERGDLRAAEMIGSWAGELGQTQFLPSHYLNHAVDYDGDGRRNLMRSVPDVLASTANYLVHIGWRAHQPWLEEVRIPARMNWAEADLAIIHPRATWAKWGVRYRNGKALPNDAKEVSLHLPMGRKGPAFLAYPNFKVYTEWNNSLTYATSAAYFATRLGGAPVVYPGRGPREDFNQRKIRDLQRLLTRRGYDVGGVDGTLGIKSRAAVKAVQQKYGLPADSYPDNRLLRRLRRR